MPEALWVFAGVVATALGAVVIEKIRTSGTIAVETAKVDQARDDTAFDEAVKWVEYGAKEMERQKGEIKALRDSEQNCDEKLRKMTRRLEEVAATAQAAHDLANGDGG